MATKEIPILFQTEMVNAILEGRKTKTRRMKGLGNVNDKPDDWLIHPSIWKNSDGQLAAIFVNKEPSAGKEFVRMPYGGKRDVLWVRETWVNLGHNNCQDGAEQRNFVVYKASQNGRDWEENMEGWRWKPSIFLKKEDSRIWLEKTNTTVERLHDITEEDAIAEGVQFYYDYVLKVNRYRNYDSKLQKEYGDPSVDYPTFTTAKESFKSLWIKINGEASWDANPWLWVNEFSVLSTTGRPDNSIPADERSVARDAR